MTPYFQGLAKRSGLPAAQAAGQQASAAGSAAGDDWAPDGVEAIVATPAADAVRATARAEQHVRPAAGIEQPVPEQAAPFLPASTPAWTGNASQVEDVAPKTVAEQEVRQVSASPPTEPTASGAKTVSQPIAEDMDPAAAAPEQLPGQETDSTAEPGEAEPWSIQRIVQAFSLGETVAQANAEGAAQTDNSQVSWAEPEMGSRSPAGRMERQQAGQRGDDALSHGAIAKARAPVPPPLSSAAATTVHVHIGKIALDIRQPAPVPVPPAVIQPAPPAARERGIALNRFYLKTD